MQIQTKYHGEMEVKKERFITFEQGIPSFLEEKSFALLNFSDENTPYYILQSIVTPSLAFVAADPFIFIKDYEVNLSDSLLEQLKIENQEDVAIFNFLTVKEPFNETTINLSGPIVINMKKKLGKQIILNDQGYSTKHKLFLQPSQAGRGE